MQIVRKPASEKRLHFVQIKWGAQFDRCGEGRCGEQGGARDLTVATACINRHALTPHGDEISEDLGGSRFKFSNMFV